MKIAVCIKRVPVMEVKFAIGKDGASVDETGLKYDVNDFDLWAVEAALQLNEKNARVRSRWSPSVPTRRRSRSGRRSRWAPTKACC